MGFSPESLRWTDLAIGQDHGHVDEPTSHPAIMSRVHNQDVTDAYQ